MGSDASEPACDSAERRSDREGPRHRVWSGSPRNWRTAIYPPTRDWPSPDRARPDRAKPDRSVLDWIRLGCPNALTKEPGRKHADAAEMRNRAISIARHWRSSRWHAAARLACRSRIDSGRWSIELASSLRRAERRTRCAAETRRHSRPTIDSSEDASLAVSSDGSIPSPVVSPTRPPTRPTCSPRSKAMPAHPAEPPPLMSATKSWAYSPPGPSRITGPAPVPTHARAPKPATRPTMSPSTSPTAIPTRRRNASATCDSEAAPRSGPASFLRSETGSDVAIRCLVFLPRSRVSAVCVWLACVWLACGWFASGWFACDRVARDRVHSSLGRHTTLSCNVRGSGCRVETRSRRRQPSTIDPTDSIRRAGRAAFGDAPIASNPARTNLPQPAAVQTASHQPIEPTPPSNPTCPSNQPSRRTRPICPRTRSGVRTFAKPCPAAQTPHSSSPTGSLAAARSLQSSSVDA